MAEAPLSSQNAESGVVVEFVPSTALPSIPGGLRTVAVIGTGKVSKTQSDASVSKGALNGIDTLTPKALSLPTTLTDANLVTYTRDVDYTLTLPTSISGAAPATSTTAGDTLEINVNGDGYKTITLATSATGAAVAADIQAKVRALTATTTTNQSAFDSFTCTYTNSLYVLTSGTTPLGSVVINGASALPNDASGALNLGTANGGTEVSGGDISWGATGAAFFEGTTDVSATAFPAGINLDGQTFQIFVDGSSSAQNVTFSGTALTSTDIETQMDAAFTGVDVSIETSGAQEFVRITTTSTDNASLQIGNGTANNNLGFTAGLISRGPSEPAVTTAYTLSYETPKITSDYSPKLFTDLTNLIAEYGEATTSNSLSLGATLVFENSGGAGAVLATQIDPAEGNDLAGFQSALSKIAAVEGVSIVVPMTTDPLLRASVKSHVVNSSAPLEKKERTAILGVEPTATTSSAIAAAAGLATGGDGRRLMLMWPGAVTRTIGGVDTTLDASYLAAATAGLRINGNYDVAEPMLRKQLTGLNSAATNLLRTEKLLLRNGGVTVVELQNGIVRITEDTTVDRTTVDSQEFPVTEIVDFVAQTIRRLLDNIFIGVKLLNDTPSIVAATVQVILNNFEALNIITASQNVRSVINPLDPRQIDVSFEIQPVRALRFIKVTFSI